MRAPTIKGQCCVYHVVVFEIISRLKIPDWKECYDEEQFSQTIDSLSHWLTNILTIPTSTVIFLGISKLLQ